MALERIRNHRPRAASAPVKQDVNRESAARRGYDRTWQRLRLLVLRGEPLCRQCGKAASQVDHITPIRKGGARLDPVNLQPLCHSCHSRKTASEDMR